MPTKIKTVVKAAEEKVAAKAEAARKEAEEVATLLPVTKQKARDVADGLTAEHDVMSRIRRGEEVDPLDLVIARTRDEIAREQAEFLEKRHQALLKQAADNDTYLAEAVAPVVKRLVPGVEVIATSAPVKSWLNEVPAGSMAVVLVQHGGADFNPATAWCKGSVEAVVIRTPMLRPLSVDALEKAGRARKVNINVRANNVGDQEVWSVVAGIESDEEIDPNAVVVDRLTMDVRALRGLPIIPRNYGNAGLPVKEWCNRVLGHYKANAGVSLARLTDLPKAPGTAFGVAYGSSRVIAGEPCISEEVEGNVRTATVVQVLNLSGLNPNEWRDDFVPVVKEFEGASITGFGLMESVEINFREPRSPGVYPLEVRMTFKSQKA